MTNEEAIKILKNNTNLGYGIIIEGESAKMIGDALEMAIAALEKQIPKKPLIVPFNESRLRTFKCPVCGSYELKKHCDDCGQLLERR